MDNWENLVLWGVTLAMGEKLQCELQELAFGVHAAGITADTALELNFSDLEFLGIGPSRITKDMPFSDRPIVYFPGSWLPGTKKATITRKCTEDE